MLSSFVVFRFGIITRAEPKIATSKGFNFLSKINSDGAQQTLQSDPDCHRRRKVLNAKTEMVESCWRKYSRAIISGI